MSVGKVVNVLSQSFFNNIGFDWDVYSDTALQVDDVLSQVLNFRVQILDFVKQLFVFKLYLLQGLL
jgi:hypothetical protein